MTQSQYTKITLLMICVDIATNCRQGSVPWNELLTRLSEFIDQEQYMPHVHLGAGERMSTPSSTQRSDIMDYSDVKYVILRDPLKMQKLEIGRLFEHWLPKQLAGETAFEFSKVLKPMRADVGRSTSDMAQAVILDEMSDVSGTSEISVQALGQSLLKGKERQVEKGKARERYYELVPVTDGEIDTPAPMGCLLLPSGPDWDLVLDPRLREEGPLLSSSYPVHKSPTGDHFVSPPPAIVDLLSPLVDGELNMDHPAVLKALAKLQTTINSPDVIMSPPSIIANDQIHGTQYLADFDMC